MANFEELLKKKKEAERKLDEANKEFTNSAKEMFKEWSKDLFSRYPALISISWTQYTPHFNDGDPCYFRSYHDDFEINNIDEDKAYEYEENGESLPGWEDKEYKKAEEKISEFLSNFNSDDMKRLFGDHCRVTITKSGVDVEGYDHD